MYIAKEKRAENIAEYILYLWQLEDLFRALQFSPEATYSQLVQPRDVDEQQKQDLFLWYMDFVNLMREEGKETIGHLEHTMHLINDLQTLHAQLMDLPIGAHYRTLFAALAPELPPLKTLIGHPQMGDIELCMRALYAVMLYRIKGDVSKGKAIEDVITLISPMIAQLAKIHRQVERGEVDLFKE